jgi:hypothetical protein
MQTQTSQRLSYVKRLCTCCCNFFGQAHARTSHGRHSLLPAPRLSRVYRLGTRPTARSNCSLIHRDEGSDNTEALQHNRGESQPGRQPEALMAFHVETAAQALPAGKGGQGLLTEHRLRTRLLL